MPSQDDAASPAKRPSAITRTSSQHSASQGSLGNTATRTKQHRASLGRLHARTPSYGKNLHKLTKIVGGDVEQAVSGASRKKPTSPISPNHEGPVRRNTSASNLSRIAAKAPVRKNKSEVSLVRNHSALHLHRGKTSAPLRRNDSHGKDLDKTKNRKQSRKFELEDDEGDWTEDSTSPVLTRQNSLTRGSKGPSRVNSPPPVQEAVMPQDEEDEGDMSPSSPPYHQRELSNFEASARVQLFDRRQSRDATQNAEVAAQQSVWSGRTLLDPVSQGRPRQSALPLVVGSTPFPSNGVSEFYEATQANVASEASLSNVTTPIIGELDSLRDSMIFDDNLRKSASTSNLPKVPLIIKKEKNTNTNIDSYTISSTGVSKAGAATQNKVDLWRTQGNITTITGPPAPMMRGAPMETLNNDERRVRLWENAEKELNAVRRFVNPVLESVRRANPKEKSQRYTGSTTVNGTPNTSRSTPDIKSGGINGVSKRANEGPRPPSRAGARSVRFEVGMDNDISKDYEGVEPVDEILQRLWSSTNEGTTVEG